jgi:hypothetical protein
VLFLGGIVLGRDTNFGDEQFRGMVSEPNFKMGEVFVVMPFADKLKDVYFAIKDECKKLRLNAIRIDDTTGSGFVLRKIYKFIEDAEFIIVDLTDERPNVYYELGYAHGVGNLENEILLIAAEGTTLHFDIAPLSVQFYSSTENLRQIVNSHLKRMIKLTRNN